jgi:hypothetical protein
MASGKNRKKKHPRKKPKQKRTKRSATSYQKMIEKLKQREDFPVTKFLIEPPGETKMSEVILDFARPYLDLAPDHQARQNMIGMAIIAWNLSLMPLLTRITAFKQIKADMNDKEAVKVVKLFVRLTRKYRKRFHPRLKRFILEFEFTETRDDMHLNVVSTVSLPKDHKGIGHA